MQPSPPPPPPPPLTPVEGMNLDVPPRVKALRHGIFGNIIFLCYLSDLNFKLAKQTSFAAKIVIST